MAWQRHSAAKAALALFDRGLVQQWGSLAQTLCCSV